MVHLQSQRFVDISTRGTAMYSEHADLVSNSKSIIFTSLENSHQQKQIDTCI